MIQRQSISEAPQLVPVGLSPAADRSRGRGGQLSGAVTRIAWLQRQELSPEGYTRVTIAIVISKYYLFWGERKLHVSTTLL